MNRQRLLAQWIGVPAALAAFGICLLETWRAVQPAAIAFAAAPISSLRDAIDRDDVQAALERIRAGDNPRTALMVSDPVLTGGRPVPVPPLVWAAARQSDRSVAMLLGYAGRPDPSEAAWAQCIARALGNETIERHVAPYASQAGPGALSPDRAQAPEVSDVKDLPVLPVVLRCVAGAAAE